jgi:FkbM family methyltransferase
MRTELFACGNRFGKRIRQAYSHLRLRRFKAHSGFSFDDDVGLRQLLKIRLKPSDTVIDCGASIGETTAVLARSHSKVFAFEPDTAAFEILEETFRDNANVVCIKKAVLDSNKKTRLYLNEQCVRSDALPPPIWWRYSAAAWYSVSSSIVPEKRGITTDVWEEVETINLSEFILKLECVVKVLKMDIEGAELAVLRELISSNDIRMVRHLFVETHENQIPEMGKDIRGMLTELTKFPQLIVHSDWR